MNTSFKTWIFERFPVYFREKDSYKDQNQKGLLERFLETLGTDLEEDDIITGEKNIIYQIENHLRIIDPTLTPEKFLNHISDSFGNPPDIFKDVDKYRKILRYILSIYKIKGTLQSYQFFYNLLGYKVSIIGYPEIDNLYDEGLLYDNSEEYDHICISCSEYDILFSNNSDDPSIPILTPLTSETLLKLRQVVFFNEPINARLRDYIYNGKLEETIDLCFKQDINIKILNLNRYDDSLYFDSGELYDLDNVSSVVPLSFDCNGDPLLEGIGYWEIETEFEIQ